MGNLIIQWISNGKFLQYCLLAKTAYKQIQKKQHYKQILEESFCKVTEKKLCRSKTVLRHEKEPDIIDIEKSTVPNIHLSYDDAYNIMILLVTR